MEYLREVGAAQSPHEAAVWISQHFEVKYLRPGSHLRKRPAPIRPAGFQGEMGLLIESGLWASMHECTRCIAPVLLYLGQKEPGEPRWIVKASFRKIGRYSGVRSPSAISKALKELQEVGWLENARPGSGTVASSWPIRSTNAYTLTPESDQLQENANARAKQMRAEIEGERQLRNEIRKEKLRETRNRSIM